MAAGKPTSAGTFCLALLRIPFQGGMPLHLALKKAYGRIDAVCDLAWSGVSTATAICLQAALFVLARAEFETLYLAGGCFRKLGHKLDSLGTLEVRQMITSVIAQLGFRRGRACF